MSPRAGYRLLSMGFEQVYDYMAGEADWFSAGLPRAGRIAERPVSGDVARKDVPTCRLDERVGEVRARVRAAGWDHAIVVNEERIVLGRLRARALDADPAATAEDVMEAGPTTIRADVTMEEMAARLRGRSVTSVVVTTPEGRLIGVLLRRDVEARLAATA